MQIKVGRQWIALIDDEDAHLVTPHLWHYSGGYARTYIDRKIIGLHRLLVSPREGFEVDHINGDRLDNRRANLRECSHAENMKNCAIYKNNRSGIKGIYFDSRYGTWRAEVKCNGSRHYLGTYRSPEEAGKAYAEAARKLFGDFVRSCG